MRSPLGAALLGVVSSGAESLPAQCAFAAVAVQPSGNGCNPVFGIGPTQSVAFDPSACAVRVTVSAYAGCCNTFLVGCVLVLGDQPAATPLPGLGFGCTLLAAPVILLWQPASVGDTFALALPPSLPPLTFHVQGGAHYLTTIGLSHDFALTAGAAVSLL